MPKLLDCPVGLLIGYDCARALLPKQVIAGDNGDPYAVKTELGWSIVGSSIGARSRPLTLGSSAATAKRESEYGTVHSPQPLEEPNPSNRGKGLSSSAKNSNEMEHKNTFAISLALMENAGQLCTRRKRRNRRHSKRAVHGGRESTNAKSKL